MRHTYRSQDYTAKAYNHKEGGEEEEVDYLVLMKEEGTDRVGGHWSKWTSFIIGPDEGVHAMYASR